MRITEVKITPVISNYKLKAFASIVLDDCFAIKDLKVIQGLSGFFVAMPSKESKDGSYRDVAHPINKGARALIESAVLTEYKKVAAERAAI